MTNPDNVGGLPELPPIPGELLDALRFHVAGSDRVRVVGLIDSYARAYGELCRAAPAGGDVERFSPDCEPCSDFESWVGCMRPDPNGDWVRAAPAGSWEVEPLPVFSGNWIYVDTGQRFSGADLDGAAFAVYEPLLRKLQQGADYVVVPRDSAKMVTHVCGEWIDLFRAAPGIEKYERYSYEPAVEELRDEYAAIAASQDQEGGK